MAALCLPMARQLVGSGKDLPVLPWRKRCNGVYRAGIEDSGCTASVERLLSRAHALPGVSQEVFSQEVGRTRSFISCYE